MRPLKITCELATPYCGNELPALEGLLEFVAASRKGRWHDLLAAANPPPFGAFPLPIQTVEMAGTMIPCCSAPIAHTDRDYAEKISKRISVENALLLDRRERKTVVTNSGKYKSHRLPIRVRAIRKIVWLCVGNPGKILDMLREVRSLGKKRSYGYGVVGRWYYDLIEEDLSLWAETPQGKLLMRPLPWCKELPQDLIGYRRDYGAVQPPYWHPARWMERVVPC